MSKNKKTLFTGVGTALITPFSGGGIDYEALGALIDYQIRNSVDALIIAGTTGEASTLCEDEYKELVSFAVRKIEGRVPVIAGSGCNDTAKSCKLTNIANNAGVDACLVVTPYYNKATQNGLLESYKEIAKSTKLPIIVYNVPTRTCVDISLSTYRELAKIENVVAVKEASPDIAATAELIFECGDNIDIYTGSDDQIIPTLALGGAGTISVASNVIPGTVGEICRLYIGGNTSGARNLFKKYYPLMRAMFYEVNPIPVKTALSMMGLCREEFRLPLCRIGDKNRLLLTEIMRDLELL
ncbi:MAG: 4-hydroxy-tetrahydrodipicolinate synthase [Ruminococcaceae bacterium]|nr:4-hydroxy-tetrahydrodipicolinate synthase [Oscillospiraceae bacterium]